MHFRGEPAHREVVAAPRLLPRAHGYPITDPSPRPDPQSRRNGALAHPAEAQHHSSGACRSPTLGRRE